MPILLAEVVGYGATADAISHISPAQDGSGAARAMENAPWKRRELHLRKLTVQLMHTEPEHIATDFETKELSSLRSKDAEKCEDQLHKIHGGHLRENLLSCWSLLCVWNRRTASNSDSGNERDRGRAGSQLYDWCAPSQEVRYAMSNSLGFGGYNGIACWKSIGGLKMELTRSWADRSMYQHQSFTALHMRQMIWHWQWSMGKPQIIQGVMGEAVENILEQEWQVEKVRRQFRRRQTRWIQSAEQPVSICCAGK